MGASELEARSGMNLPHVPGACVQSTPSDAIAPTRPRGSNPGFGQGSAMAQAGVMGQQVPCSLPPICALIPMDGRCYFRETPLTDSEVPRIHGDPFLLQHPLTAVTALEMSHATIPCRWNHCPHRRRLWNGEQNLHTNSRCCRGLRKRCRLCETNFQRRQKEGAAEVD